MFEDLNNEDEINDDLVTQPVNPFFYFSVLVICWSIGGFLCTKACFGRDVGTETELIDNLELICSNYSKNSNVQCSLKIERRISKWMCRGGLSCAPGVDSICGIEFILNTDHNSIEEFGDDPVPSAPEAEYEHVVEATVVKMASSKSL